MTLTWKNFWKNWYVRCVLLGSYIYGAVLWETALTDPVISFHLFEPHWWDRVIITFRQLIKLLAILQNKRSLKHICLHRFQSIYFFVPSRTWFISIQIWNVTSIRISIMRTRRSYDRFSIWRNPIPPDSAYNESGPRSCRYTMHEQETSPLLPTDDVIILDNATPSADIVPSTTIFFGYLEYFSLIYSKCPMKSHRTENLFAIVDSLLNKFVISANWHIDLIKEWQNRRNSHHVPYI